ncbi:MAG TPA: sigma-E factor regulatory protein RseB domain-containing protein [Fimbriimonas sp.]|nr:sigma-E factor regulatory protein RseB domain-containing protein [Fimbriimonas sp.]
MNRFYCLGAVSLLLPLALGQVGARPAKLSKQAQVPPVLKRALEAGPKLRYIGTRVIEFRKQGQTERYSEIVTREGGFTRIEFPEGSKYQGQIIVETPRERRHFFPDKNEIRILPPRREEALHRLARLAHSDKFVFAGGPPASVAGVRTAQVVVTDKAGNVMQRIFIEPKTGLLVKRQMFDMGGAPVGLYQFSQLNMNPKINPMIFRLDRKGARIIRPIDTLRELAKKQGFPLAALPPSSGYMLHFSNVRPIDGQNVLMSFYGADNGRLSLFVTKEPLDAAKLKNFGRGTVNVYTWREAGLSLALIGNQDQEALRRLAGTVSFGT